MEMVNERTVTNETGVRLANKVKNKLSGLFKNSNKVLCGVYGITIIN